MTSSQRQIDVLRGKASMLPQKADILCRKALAYCKDCKKVSRLLEDKQNILNEKTLVHCKDK